MEFVALWILFGVFSALIASSRSLSGCGWGLLGIFSGPFGLLVAALPKVDPVATRPTRRCPLCTQTILREARVCRSCGRYVGEEHREQS